MIKPREVMRVLLIISMFACRFRCGYTLFRFYLSPNCTENYVGYTLRLDTPDIPPCNKTSCQKFYSNYYTTECAPTNWDPDNEPSEFVRSTFSLSSDLCYGGAPVSIEAAKPNQCIVIPYQNYPNTYNFNECDPVTGAVTYSQAEHSSDCKNDIMHIVSYPNCDKVLGWVWGYNNCVLKEPPVPPVPPVPMAEPQTTPDASPIAPPLNNEPLPTPETIPSSNEPLSGPDNVPLVTPRSDPISDEPIQSIESPILSPIVDDSTYSNEVYWTSVAIVLAAGIILGSAITSLICIKRRKRMAYNTIQSNN